MRNWQAREKQRVLWKGGNNMENLFEIFKDLKIHIAIRTPDESTKKDIYESISRQLAGNDGYESGNIVLSMDANDVDSDGVSLYVYDGHEGNSLDIII